MKTYFRILGFAFPISKRLTLYIISTILSIVFGVMNFSLIIPLLNILFNTENTKAIEITQLPSFSFSVEYFIDYFNFTFNSIIKIQGKIMALQFVCLAVVISVIISNIFKYIASVQIQWIRYQTIINIREALFHKISILNLGYYSNERKGDLITRLTTDVNEVEISVTSTMAVFFKEPFTLIVYFVALLNISPTLTIFTLITIPISGVLISIISKKIRKESNELSIISGKVMTIIEESLYSMRLTKSFNAENYIREKYRNESKRYSWLMKKIFIRKEMYSPYSEITGVLVVTMILLYGGTLVLENNSTLSASQFLGYIVLFSQLLRPAKAISSAITDIQKGLVSGDRIIQVLETKESINDPETPKILNQFSNKIEFKNVSFTYDIKETLKNINFDLEKGKMIALVGPSGGGKSTLADLVPRFYDPTKGEILIDGLNLKEITQFGLREQIGVVAQEAFMFNDTIYNNIVFGKQNVTDAEVEAAAKIANAHDFIIKSDNGYHTEIGDRGVKLSGGQKQRLSIARAVLRNPAILILDEATSALDTESEKLVQESLDKLMQNRTTLVIAHRLSTIQKADLILVINHGEIVERGSHQELIQVENGLYRKLYELQSL